MIDISKIEGFEWDKGNSSKNKEKHNVSKDECEEVFFNQPVRFFDDEIHSKTEKRYGILGKTNKGRKIVVFFTVRSKRIRVISARSQGIKDKKVYNEVEQAFIKEYEVK